MSQHDTQPESAHHSFRPAQALTFDEAAAATGKSSDTIKRRHKAGAFPGAFTRPGDNRGTWLIPVTDLVAAGLLDAEALQDVAETVATARHGREAAALEVARQDGAIKVAALQAQVAGLEQLVAALTDERDYLRTAHADLIAKAA